MKYILAILTLLISTNSIANHKTLDGELTLKAGKNLVQEIFYYACHHCQQIEEPLLKWANSVENNTVVEKVPVVLSPKQRMAAKHFYASKLLNIESDFSKKYFEEIQKGKLISDELAIKLMTQLGEKKDKVLEAFNSNWVEKRIEKARELTLKLKVNTVPIFLLNGKYMIKRSSFDKDEVLFRYIERLSR